VDVRKISGAPIATGVRNTAQPVQPSAGDDPAVETRIAEIIADNSGQQVGGHVGRAAVSADNVHPAAVP
jgi:hypothetical protein